MNVVLISTLNVKYSVVGCFIIYNNNIHNHYLGISLLFMLNYNTVFYVYFNFKGVLLFFIILVVVLIQRQFAYLNLLQQ